MTITEKKPSQVLNALVSGDSVICIDFEKGMYIDLSGQSIARIQRLMASENTKFFEVDRSEDNG